VATGSLSQCTHYTAVCLSAVSVTACCWCYW